MWTLTRPSAERVAAFREAQRALPFTYPDPGCTRPDGALPPAGFVRDHNRQLLGRGSAAFAAARAALADWAMFAPPLSAIEPHVPIVVGEVPGVLVHAFGIWFTNAARIVYVDDNTAPPFGGAAARGQAPVDDNTAPPFGGGAARGQAPVDDNTAPPFGGGAARGQAPVDDNTAPPFGGGAARGQAPVDDNTAPPFGGGAARGQAPVDDNTAPPFGGGAARGQAPVVDEPRRFAFAYGTLPGHAERGEERFLVEHLADDTVWFELVAFSRPRLWLARLARPLARMLQRRFARLAKARMLALVSGA